MQIAVARLSKCGDGAVANSDPQPHHVVPPNIPSDSGLPRNLERNSNSQNRWSRDLERATSPLPANVEARSPHAILPSAVLGMGEFGTFLSLEIIFRQPSYCGNVVQMEIAIHENIPV